MSRLSITLLGGFHVRLDSGRAVSLTRTRAQTVAFLAMPAGRPHSREELAALLSSGVSNDAARTTLRQVLFGIRKAFGPMASSLVVQGQTVWLDRAMVDVDVDVDRFKQAVSEGTPDALRRAADLYSGEFLAGMVVPEDSPFEEWLLTERERLRNLAEACLLKLVKYHRRRSETELAIQEALRLLAINPLQESVSRVLMDLYANSGRRGSALRQYQLCVTALQHELGVEPEPETQALYQAILRSPDRRRPAASSVVHGPLMSDTLLVGRAAELSVLCEALLDARTGHGRVVTVLGEAGIGKTRLMTELASEASRRDVAVLVGYAYESEQALPFGPLADALRGARVSDDIALLDELGPSHRAHLAHVLPEVQADVGSGDEHADDRRIFDSVASLVRLLAARRPLVMMLEDVHWADQMTVRLTTFLAHRLQAWPVVLVLTVRNDDLADLSHLVAALDELDREPHASRLVLPPLTRSSTETLVQALNRGGDPQALRSLAEYVWTISEGNPFVAMEVMRAAERHAATAALTMPQRVREMVERRLDRLGEVSQHLVAVAAVIGRDFEFALLQRASGLAVDAAAAGVEELVRRRVVHGVGERLDFVHSRIRETALARLLPHRRTMLSAAVVEALEALHDGRLESYDVALAGHCRSAGLWDRAMLYSGRAGMRAASAGAWREAVALLREALDALEHLPEAPGTAQLRADILLAIAMTRYSVGDLQGMLTTLQAAEAITRDSGDERRCRRALEGIAAAWCGLGDMSRALEAVERASALGGDGSGTTTIVFQGALTYYFRGDYRRALEAARVEARIVGGGHASLRRWGYRLSVRVRTWIVLSLAELGDFAEGLRTADEMLALVDTTNATDLFLAGFARGRTHLLRGDWPQATAILEPLLPLCEVEGFRYVYWSRLASTLGLAHVRSGRTEEGLALLQEAVTVDEALPLKYSQSLHLAYLAEGYLVAGDVAAADRSAGQALESARRHGQRGWEAWALRAQGEVARARGEGDAALRWYRAALKLARTLEMQPLAAHCHRGLGIAETRPQVRADHRRTAARMYFDLGMCGWEHDLP